MRKAWTASFSTLIGRLLSISVSCRSSYEFQAGLGCLLVLQDLGERRGLAGLGEDEEKDILVLGCLIRAVVPKGVDEAERAAPSCISQFFHPSSSSV